MTWNHRVVKVKIGRKTWYSIREVFYNDAKEIMGYTEDAVGVVGDNVDELRESLHRMLKCLDHPEIVEGKTKVVGFDDPQPKRRTRRGKGA